MARTVFLHIGLPKTGTTYLQQVLWSNKSALRAEGILVPGFGHREHLWAALDAQDRKRLERRHPRAPGAWGRICAELAPWTGVGLVSHEFFCGAGRSQIVRMVDALAPAEVHVVVTARHSLAMLSAGWQELVKNGGTARPEEIPDEGGGRTSEFSWRTWDLGGVLTRWGSVLPPDRVHVLALPGPGDPPEQHWLNFARTVGIGGEYELPERPANVSLGVVQVELLRRINADLTGFGSPSDRGTWIRGHLAEDWLARQGGEPFGLDPDLVEECRERSRKAVDLVASRGFDVVGRLDSLLVPDDVPIRRTRADVTNEELVSASSKVLAVMLTEIRDTTRDLGRTRKKFIRSHRFGPTQADA